MKLIHALRTKDPNPSILESLFGHFHSYQRLPGIPHHRSALTERFPYIHQQSEAKMDEDINNNTEKSENKLHGPYGNNPISYSSTYRSIQRQHDHL